MAAETYHKEAIAGVSCPSLMKLLLAAPHRDLDR